jgi:ABC-type nitrate/sulfonate/bicarbonate transport system permease component
VVSSQWLNRTGWLVFVGLVLTWELAAHVHAPWRFYIPPMHQIIASLVQVMASGEIAHHMLTTLMRFFTGYLIAAVIAVSLGMMLGYFPFGHSLLETLIEFLRPMPSVAIIPVAILLLGIGDGMIVAVTVYASLWPILINTIDGVKRIDPVLVQTGRIFGLGPWRLLRRVILPAASPYIVTGLRISLAIALILVTTAEMIAGGTGLGFFILDEERSLRNSHMYAGIIVVSLLGYLLNRLLLLVEARMMRWRRGMIAREKFWR